MSDSPARLLVVDDDDAFRHTVSRILTDAGFEVLEANSFAAALTALDTSAPVDLLLTDLRLAPGTPHGFSMARVIQSRLPSIKLLFMTGGNADDFALSRPDDVVLKKPFRSKELVASVLAALGRDAG